MVSTPYCVNRMRGLSNGSCGHTPKKPATQRYSSIDSFPVEEDLGATGSACSFPKSCGFQTRKARIRAGTFSPQPTSQALFTLLTSHGLTFLFIKEHSPRKLSKNLRLDVRVPQPSPSHPNPRRPSTLQHLSLLFPLNPKTLSLETVEEFTPLRSFSAILHFSPQPTTTKLSSHGSRLTAHFSLLLVLHPATLFSKSSKNLPPDVRFLKFVT